jgi:uncharacterized small protein (DUF1192 family)
MEADEPRGKQVASLVGGDLSALSIHELEARIETLRAEIIRVEAAIRAKKSSAEAANSVFRM